MPLCGANRASSFKAPYFRRQLVRPEGLEPPT
jgi:hypothetical protein